MIKGRNFFKIIICASCLFTNLNLINSMQASVNNTTELTGTVSSASLDSNANQEKIDKVVGAHNVDMSEEKIGVCGNWVKKKEWIKEAFAINNKIQDSVAEIENSRPIFQEKLQKADEIFNGFYRTEGFEQSKLQELFSSVEKYLEKKLKREKEKEKQDVKSAGVTSDDEIKINLLEQEVKSRKIELDQLKLDLSSLMELDKSVKDRINIVNKYIDMAVSLAKKATDITDQLWYIIDDRIARRNYYELKNNIWEKVKTIQEYVNTQMIKDVDNVLTIIDTQINKTKEEIKTLEQNGIIIQDRAKRVEKLKLADLEKAKAVQEMTKKVQRKSVAELSFISRCYNFFGDIFTSIYNYFKNLF